jgi:hypothetical protein
MKILKVQNLSVLRFSQSFHTCYCKHFDNRKSNFDSKAMKILKVPEFVSTKVFTVISHMLLELGNNTLDWIF